MIRHVFVMRHGRAEMGHVDGDAARRLTADGERGVRHIAAALNAMPVRAHTLWHSPYVRATQTAAIVGDALSIGPRVVNPELTPNGIAAVVANTIRAVPPDDAGRALFVVSHLPFLPALVDALVGASCSVNLTPGSVVQLSMLEGRDAVLSGVYRAEALEGLGARLA